MNHNIPNTILYNLSSVTNLQHSVLSNDIYNYCYKKHQHLAHCYIYKYMPPFF